MVRAGNGGDRMGASQISTHMLKSSFCALPPLKRRLGLQGIDRQGPGRILSSTGSSAAAAGASAAPGARGACDQRDRANHPQPARQGRRMSFFPL